jgi:hypothetical protein
VKHNANAVLVGKAKRPSISALSAGDSSDLSSDSDNDGYDKERNNRNKKASRSSN